MSIQNQRTRTPSPVSKVSNFNAGASSGQNTNQTPMKNIYKQLLKEMERESANLLKRQENLETNIQDKKMKVEQSIGKKGKKKRTNCTNNLLFMSLYSGKFSALRVQTKKNC